MKDENAHPELNSSPMHFRISLCLIAFALAAQVYLIWSSTYPPLVDLPHHMARHYLEHRSLSGAELPSYYRIEYRLLPNLGGDLIVTLLLFFLDPYTACKVFLTLCVLVAWGGPALFILQYGAYRPPALAAALLFLPWSFGSAFFWGFLNYSSGLGLAFLVLCHYFHLRKQPSLRPGSLVLHTFLVSLLVVWHLAAWGIYGVFVGCHLLGQALTDYRAERNAGKTLWRLFVFALPSLMSLLLFALVMSQPRENALAGVFDWGGWFRKETIHLTIFRGYYSIVDGVVLLLWLLAVIAMFRFQFREPLRPNWLFSCLLALVALYLLLPYQLGTTSSTDLRLLPAILICLLALAGTLPMRKFSVGAALLLVVLLLRFVSIGYAWRELGQRLDCHAQSFVHMERRSKVMPVVLAPLTKEFPEVNFLGWAVLEREVFVPNLLALEGQQPLRLQQEKRIFVEKKGDCYQFDEAAVGKHYNYVWIYNPDCQKIAIPKRWKQVYSKNFLMLCRVE